MKQDTSGIVAIRVDSSIEIGSGHLVRCLTLGAQMREAKYDVHFICRDLVGALFSLVEAQGFSLHILPRHEPCVNLKGYAAWLTVTQKEDVPETQDVLRRIAPIARLVIDSYAIDETWEKEMRSFADEIFVIDDLANRRHDCDVLLDQNFYRGMEHRYDGLVPESCRRLLGPKYALLRQEFYEAKKKLRLRDGVLRRILVFYGGIDGTRETEKAIQALLLLKCPQTEVDVVVGRGNMWAEEICRLCEAHDFLHFHIQVSNMAELMANADLCLGAGGTTTWERCFLGLPAIVTAVAENQFQVCADCAEAGFIHYIGRWKDVSVDNIVQAMKTYTLSERLSRLQEACCFNGISF